jgi:hypothetical protein
MREIQAFRQMTQTHAIAAATTPPTPIQIPVVRPELTGSQVNSVVFLNPSAVDVWVGVGPTAAIATANCVIPTPGSPTNARMIPRGTAPTLDFPRDAFVTARTASGSVTLYVAAGAGL